mmetsp:Transcript_18912/g.54190  ORF Transcript_18912/g.54190 Transcript_18912/m.54190 type:complete len:320 (-) Transcript_18912:406-1365(-)
MLEQTDHFEGDRWRARKTRAVDAGRVDEALGDLALLDDPVAAVRLCACAAEGVNHFAGVELRDEFLAIGEDVFHDLLVAHVKAACVVDVAGRRPKDEVAPERRLHQNALSELWVGAREERVAGKVALVLVEEQVITEAGLDREALVTDHARHLVGEEARAVDNVLGAESDVAALVSCLEGKRRVLCLCADISPTPAHRAAQKKTHDGKEGDCRHAKASQDGWVVQLAHPTRRLEREPEPGDDHSTEAGCHLRRRLASRTIRPESGVPVASPDDKLARGLVAVNAEDFVANAHVNAVVAGILREGDGVLVGRHRPGVRRV